MIFAGFTRNSSSPTHFYLNDSPTYHSNIPRQDSQISGFRLLIQVTYPRIRVIIVAMGKSLITTLLNVGRKEGKGRTSLVASQIQDPKKMSFDSLSGATH